MMMQKLWMSWPIVKENAWLKYLFYRLFRVLMRIPIRTGFMAGTVYRLLADE